MVEPLSVVYHAVKRSMFAAGNTVLIIGAGPVGTSTLRSSTLTKFSHFLLLAYASDWLTAPKGSPVCLFCLSRFSGSRFCSLGPIITFGSAFGASWIGVSEPASGRRSTALGHFASAVFDPLSCDVASEVLQLLPPLAGGVDVVFDCAGNQASLDTALKAVKPRGNIAEIAVWEKDATLNVNRIMAKEILFTGGSHGLPFSCRGT